MKGTQGLLSFPEYQQFAGNIIDDHNQNTGHKLHDVAVPVQAVHGEKNDYRLKSTGGNAAAYKSGQFRNHGFCRPVMASEYKGLVGKVCKGNRTGPGNHITDCSRKMQQIVAGQVYKIIDRRGQNAEYQIYKNVIMFFKQRADLLNQNAASRIFSTTDSMPVLL